VAATIASLAWVWNRLDRPEIAVTLVGISTQYPYVVSVVNLTDLNSPPPLKLGDRTADGPSRRAPRWTSPTDPLRPRPDRHCAARPGRRRMT
jgi:hypothetical protein